MMPLQPNFLASLAAFAIGATNAFF